MTDDSQALEALNLLGKRSENLVSSYASDEYSYATEGNVMTVTATSGRVIKVTFQK